MENKFEKYCNISLIIGLFKINMKDVEIEVPVQSIKELIISKDKTILIISNKNKP